jgi:hypothetical protein
MTSRTQDGAGLADLLPGDDPALLPGPDRIELYPVIGVHDVNPASNTRSAL